MEFYPRKLAFSDVLLRQPYQSNITLTNTFTATVSFAITSSTPRLKVSQSNVTLQPGQSIVLTVTLFVNHRNEATSTIEDHIRFHSDFQDFQVKVTYTLANSSRNSSPSRAGMISSNVKPPTSFSRKRDAQDMIEEQAAQIKNKNNRIEELERILGNLESKYPNFDAVIKSRLAIQQQEFEAKSKGIVEILERKDAEIKRLKSELAVAVESATTHKNLRQKEEQDRIASEGKSKHFWTQRTVDTKSNESEIRVLVSEVESLRSELGKTQQSLNAARNEIELQQQSDVRSQQRAASVVPSSASHVHLKELTGLREKTMDQAQQIEALNNELSKAHKSLQERDRAFEELNHTRSEIENLRSELKKSQIKFEQLVSSHNGLQRECEGLHQKLLLTDQQIARFQNVSAYSHHLPRNAVDDAHHPTHVQWHDQPSSHRQQQQQQSGQGSQQAIHVGDRQYEHEVGGQGGVSTTTPTYFGVETKLTAQEKESALRDYKDKLMKLEYENETLRSKLAESRNVEMNIRERMNQLEARVSSSDHDGRIHYERAERLKSAQDEAKLALQDRELQLQTALEKANAKTAETNTHDAHVWWSYVWHEMRKQQQQNATAGIEETLSTAAPGELNYNTGATLEASVAYHTNKMKDNLRSQAIEIANLRQELLGRQLSTKKEMDDLKSQLDAARRNEVALTAAARIHKGDKDMKIAEMADTIRSLTSRSDIHVQLASARQEVETQKLTNHHLRADLDSYRLMLEEEQRKVQSSRKEMTTLQTAIDSMAVYQTIMHIPGVQPGVLIEVMSGQINQLQSDLSRNKASLAESVALAKSLQHSVATQARRVTYEDGPTQETPRRSAFGSTLPSTRRNATRSLSPSGRSPRTAYAPTSDIGVAYDELLRASTSSRAPSKQETKVLPSVSSPRMAVLRPNTSSPDLTLNDTIDDERADALHPVHSKYKYGNMDMTGDFHVVIDTETTPKMLLDSFDIAILVQRVKTQDNTIVELQQRVDDLTENALEEQKQFLLDRDSGDFGDRVELDNTLRRFELLTTQYEETQQELTSVKERNVLLEKTLRDREIDSFVHSIHPKEGIANTLLSGIDDELPLLSQHNPADTSSTMSTVNVTSSQLQQAYENNEKELESTKITLRERTTQLKVLMETLDSLQMAGVGVSMDRSALSGHTSDEDAQLFASRSSRSGARRPGGASGLSDLAHMTVGMPANMETSWGLQALIKRVVELTTELASQCAVASLEERRAADAEANNKRKSKDISRLKAAVKASDEELCQVKLALSSLTKQLKEKEHDAVASIAALKQQNDALSNALRQSECDMSNAELRISELNEQCKLEDHSDFQSWLEIVTLDNQKILTSSFTAIKEQQQGDESGGVAEFKDSETNSKSISDSSVRDLVLSLITQWKEFVGSVPLSSAKSHTTTTSSTHSISKAEQRFLQRVTDLVMNANERASAAASEMQNYELQSRRAELMARISNERLQICAQHLNRYRKRCQAYENVINSDIKNSTAKQSRLEALLRRALKDARQKYDSCSEALRNEHRDHQIIDLKRLLDVNQLRKLQAQVAEYESRGSATLRGRDEAIQSLERKLKMAEDAMFKWFKVELPRLVSGLPVTEDSLSTYYQEANALSDSNAYGFEYKQSGTDILFEEKQGGITTQLISSLGMDKTFALSQALCTSKATQTAQEMRIAGLMEKLSICKERNLELEGVIIRWKDQINHSLYQQQQAASRKSSETQSYTISVADGALSNLDSLIQQVYVNADNEKILTAQINELRDRLVEIEEENIEARGRLQHANVRSAEMKTLVDTVMADEQAIKTKATQQITKMRVELENEHAVELRRLRQSYESDKRALIGELEKVSMAVKEANLPDVDPFAWQRLIDGTGKDGDIRIESSFRNDRRTADKVSSNKQYEDLLFSSPSSDDGSHGHHTPPPKAAHTHSSVYESESDHQQSPSSTSSSSGSEDGHDERKVADKTTTAATVEIDQAIDDINKAVFTDKKIRRKKSDIVDRGTKKHKKLRHNHPESNSPDSSVVSVHSVDHHRDALKDVEIENMSRALEMERRKTEEYKKEMEELEQMLSVQQSVFKTHLDKEHTILSNSFTNDSTHGATVSSRRDSNAAPEHSIESEVRKEDRALWPSLGPLVDELLTVLRSAASKSSSSSDSDLIRTAMAMAARVKVICTSESNIHASVPTTQSRAETSFRDFNTSFHGENVSGPLKSLVSRVQLLESDFHEDKSIPEKHLYLLRDLRVRVVEMEKTMTEHENRQKQEWNAERQALVRVAQESADAAEQQRIDQEHTMMNVRKRYEEALYHSHEEKDLLEQQVQALRQEIGRLVSALNSRGHVSSSARPHQPSNYSHDNVLQQQVTQLESQHNREIAELKAHFSRYKRAQEEIVHSLENDIEELHSTGNNVSMNAFLDTASTHSTFNSIQEAEDKMRRMDYKYRTKVKELEAVMRALSRSVIDDDHTKTRDRTDSLHSNANDVSMDESYSAIVLLPTDTTRPPPPPPVRSVMRQSREGPVASKGIAMNSPIPGTEQQQSVQPTVGASNEIKEEIHLARQMAAESEIEALHRNLLRERNIIQSLHDKLKETVTKANEYYASSQAQIAELRATNSQIGVGLPLPMSNRGPQGVRSSRDGLISGGNTSSSNVDNFMFNDAFLTDYSHEFVVPEGEGVKEKTKQLVKRMNLLRQNARTEVTRLKDHIIHMQNEATAFKEELTKQREAVVEIKGNLVQQRKENAQKTKLLLALKTAKASDSNALEQWRNEVAQLEEQNKRLQRAVASKDAMLRDLKVKIDIYEEHNAGTDTPQKAIPTSSGVHAAEPLKDGPDGIANLPVTELRARLKASELERSRARSRIQGLKDRVVELETEAKTLHEENERLKRVNEKSEALKNSMQRKEQQIGTLRTQLDKTHHELNEAKSSELAHRVESEKTISQLQRRIDSLERQTQDLTREHELVRQRSDEVSEQLNHRAAVNRSVEEEERIRSNIQDLSRRGITFSNQTSQASTAPSQYRSALKPSVTSSIALPTSLDASTTNDIQNMMSALGRTTSNIASPLSRPTTSSSIRPGVSSGTVNTSRSSASHLDVSSSSGESSGQLLGATSTEKRIKSLIESALQSPTRQRNLNK